jgi:two-component system, NtrC family, response regulator AtoC
MVRNALARRDLEEENRRLKTSIEQMQRFDRILGRSPAIMRVLKRIDSVAPSDSPVLIRGECGTGKQLAARVIHARSDRRYLPLVIVPGDARFDGEGPSDLLGHGRGTDTGASSGPGAEFGPAAGGSILINEVGGLDSQGQTQLFRVLKERRNNRGRDHQAIAADFRLLTSTSRDLEALVAAGGFREDLFRRLNVLAIRMPSLRERPDDIAVLAEYFLQRLSRALSRPVASLAPAALELLAGHDWPGNVRELRNAVERAALTCRRGRIEPGDLQLGGGSAAVPRSRTLADAERAHVETVLREVGWNISRAARSLAIDRVTLYNKIRRYGLQRPGAGPPV